MPQESGQSLLDFAKGPPPKRKSTASPIETPTPPQESLLDFAKGPPLVRQSQVRHPSDTKYGYFPVDPMAATLDPQGGAPPLQAQQPPALAGDITKSGTKERPLTRKDIETMRKVAQMAASPMTAGVAAAPKPAKPKPRIPGTPPGNAGQSIRAATKSEVQGPGVGARVKRFVDEGIANQDLNKKVQRAGETDADRAIRGVNEFTSELEALIKPVSDPIGAALSKLTLAGQTGLVPPEEAGPMLSRAIAGLVTAPFHTGADLVVALPGSGATPEQHIRGGLNVARDVLFSDAVAGGEIVKKGARAAVGSTTKGKAALAISDATKSGIKTKPAIKPPVKAADVAARIDVDKMDQEAKAQIPKARETAMDKKFAAGDVEGLKKSVEGKGAPKVETPASTAVKKAPGAKNVPATKAVKSKTETKPPVSPKSEPQPDVTSTPPDKTGVSMHARTQDSIKRGTPMPESIKGLSNEEAYNRAFARKGEVDADSLLENLAKNKRPASQDEIADIAVRRGSYIQEVERLAKKLDEADDATIRDQYNALHDKIARFDSDLDIVKAENGRSLNALKIGNRVEDMGFEEVKAEARRRYGVDVDDHKNFKKKFEDLEAQHKETQAAHDIKSKEVEDLKAELEAQSVKANPEIVKKIKADSSIARKAATATKRAQIDTQLEDLKARWQNRGGKGLPKNRRLRGGMADYDPDTWKMLGEAVTLYAKKGLVKIEELSNALVDTFEGLSHRDAIRAIGRHYEQPKRVQTELGAALAEARTLAKHSSKINDAIEGVVRKFNQGAEPSALAKELKKALDETLEVKGLDSQGRPINQVKIDALSAKIKKATAQFKGGFRDIPAQKVAVEELENLANELAEIRGKTKLTDKIYHLEDDLRELLDTGSLPPKAAAPKKAKSAEVLKLERRRADLIKRIETITGVKKGAPRSEASKLAAARKRIQKLSDQLEKGYRDIKHKAEVSAELKALQGKAADIQKSIKMTDEISDLEEQLRTMNLKPAKTKEARKMEGQMEILQNRLQSLRKQKVVALKSLEPKTIFSRINRAGRDIQLTNVEARIMDVLSNTTKMASYVAQNPLRSIMGKVLFGKTGGREVLRSWKATRQIFENAPARWKQEAYDVLKGVDMDTLEKYGANQGIVTRATGLTDVPFRDAYYRMAVQDYVATTAKSADEASAMWAQITKGEKGPLTDQALTEVKAMAHDWSLRQTYNVDNLASKVAEGLKTSPARYLEAQIPGRAGKEAGDAWRLLTDSITRFSRVIGNVALEKANYAYGLQEAGLRLARGKIGAALDAPIPKGATKMEIAKIRAVEGLFGKIPAKDARLIVDLASRGLTGLGLYHLGKASYTYLKDQDWIEIKVVTTDGGTKFVKTTLFPRFLGGIEADQLGGPISAILNGATEEMIDKIPLKADDTKGPGMTATQKASLIKRTRLDAYMNQPIESGPQDFLKNVFSAEGNPEKYAGSMIGRQIIPGVVSKTAERMDKSRTGVELRKSATFWDEFQKRIPWLREGLPANEPKRETQLREREKRERVGR